MFCPHCGKEFALEANFCPVCGARSSNSPFAAAPQARMVRPRQERLVAGVCAGFALRYGWDLTLTRILFSVVTVLTFPLGVIAYAIAWILMPDAQFALPPSVQ